MKKIYRTEEPPERVLPNWIATQRTSIKRRLLLLYQSISQSFQRFPPNWSPLVHIPTSLSIRERRQKINTARIIIIIRENNTDKTAEEREFQRLLYWNVTIILFFQLIDQLSLIDLDLFAQIEKFTCVPETHIIKLPQTSDVHLQTSPILVRSIGKQSFDSQHNSINSNPCVVFRTLCCRFWLFLFLSF